MLLALGAPIPLAPEPTVGLDGTMAVLYFGPQREPFFVTRIDIHRRRQMVDVTSSIDSERQYIAGLPSTGFHLVGYFERSPPFLCFDESVSFDEVIGGHRLQADLLLTNVRTVMELGGRQMWEVDAEALGPVTVDAADAQAPPPELPSGRRAMSFG